MDALIDIDQLKAHLKLTGTAEDDDLQLKLDAAHAVVENYLKQRVSDQSDWEATVDAWTVDTAPKQVLAAILMQAGELYRYRGDDEAADQHDKREFGMLSPYVVAMLYRLRDPALA